MADYLINVFLDDAKMKTIEGAGLAGQVKDIGGKKAIQVPVNEKEQKKLVKGFPDLKFDASNACVLPPATPRNTLNSPRCTSRARRGSG